jgi:hypothetical protein
MISRPSKNYHQQTFQNCDPQISKNYGSTTFYYLRSANPQRTIISQSLKTMINKPQKNYGQNNPS